MMMMIARRIQSRSIRYRFNRFDRFISSASSSQHHQQPLLIRNGLIVNHDSSFVGDVLCVGKTIAAVGKSAAEHPAAESAQVIDAGNLMVIPGGIDPHTHMEMPFMGTVSIDDYAYGTRAALAGGTTHLIDFVIPRRQESLVDAYHTWHDRAQPAIHTDISFHMAVTWFGEQVLADMTKLTHEYGVQSYKFFLAYNNALRTYDDEILKLLYHCRELGAVGAAHCENGDMVEDAAARLIAAGITSPVGHGLSRPETNEAEATKRAISLAEQTQTPLLIVHCMSISAAEEIARAKQRGVNVYGETLAATLACTGAELRSSDFAHAAAHVMSPPLREDTRTRGYMMDAVKSRIIDHVATDNCTFTTAQKSVGADDFRLIPNGVNGIEDRMSIVWNHGVKGATALSPCEFVRATSTAAALLFNLYPRKGRIAVGSDADLVLWNGEMQRTVSARTHHHAVDVNIFEGMELYGVVETTISGGKVAYDGTTIVAEPGDGIIVPRKPFQYAYRHRPPSTITSPMSNRRQYSTTATNSHEPHSLEQTLYDNLQGDDLRFVTRTLFGENMGTVVPSTDVEGDFNDFDVKMNRFRAPDDTLNPPRMTRFGVAQCAIIEPTDAPIQQQYDALLERHLEFVEAAATANCGILCFQEAWHMPFAFATREKLPWTSFAQSAEDGHATRVLCEAAARHNMVIISPILERDAAHGDVLFNTAVVIDNHGRVLGKHRKNHIPRVGDFNESTYYFEGDDGWPVFETEFGNIAVNICYGRHHALNWMGFALNGAEIVFNPSATVSGLSECMWAIEARCAAVQNNYFVACCNRVGTESFPRPFTSADGKHEHNDFGHFYGSSYIAGPDASRTHGLSRVRDGLLIAEADLNLCQQVKDRWTFQMTARYKDYAQLLARYCQPDFKPQRVK